MPDRVWNSSSSGTDGPFATSQRKRLQLKPRSVRPNDSASGSSNGGVMMASPSSSTKPNPFGSAKPREEVLATKGIDPSTIDEKIAKKVASNTRFTKEQDQQLEVVRAQLTKVEEELRRANEMELPEEAFRVQVETQRKQLQDLMTTFATENAQEAALLQQQQHQQQHQQPKSSNGRQQFERPSERRRRLEQERNGQQHLHGGPSFNNEGNRGNRNSYHSQYDM